MTDDEPNTKSYALIGGGLVILLLFLGLAYSWKYDDSQIRQQISNMADSLNGKANSNDLSALSDSDRKLSDQTQLLNLTLLLISNSTTSKMDLLSSNDTAIKNQIDAQNTRFNQDETNISTIQSGMANLQTQINSQSNILSTMYGNISTISDNCTSHGEAIYNLIVVQNSIQYRLDTLNTSLNIIIGNVSSIQSKMCAFNSSLC